MKRSITLVKISHQHLIHVATQRGNLTTKKCVHITDKQLRRENGGYIYAFLSFKCTHVIKLSMEMNDDTSDLKDSFGEVLVTITCEMCRQIMISVRSRLELCVQSGGQCFENLCKVASLHFRHEGHKLASLERALF